LDDFSGNPSYCKSCWREYNEKQRRKKGVKKQKRIETRVVDGVLMRRCSKCGVWFPKKSNAYCKECRKEYMKKYNERRAKN
jgi:hypothetical protein